MNRFFFRKVIFYLLLFAAWWLLSETKHWPDYLFPSPVEVVGTLWRGLIEGSYAWAILASFRRLLIGYAISVAVGVPLGVLLARLSWADETLGSLILGLQTLPSVCWLPLALLWFGLNDSAIIFVIVLGSFLSISLATKSGIQQVAPVLVQAARCMGAKGPRLYLHVILPAALPILLDGLKQGWSFAWRSLMAGELLFVSVGLGHLLDIGRELNDMSQVISVILIVIALGLIIDRFVFGNLEKRLAERWGFQQRV